MVKDKPPQSAREGADKYARDTQHESNVLPYPVFPDEASQPSRRRSSAFSRLDTEDPNSYKSPHNPSNIPASLRISPKTSFENLRKSQEELAASNAGRGAAGTHSSSIAPTNREQETVPPTQLAQVHQSYITTNPYHRSQNNGAQDFPTGAESSAAIWGSAQGFHPVEGTTLHTLTSRTSQLSLKGETRTSLKEPSNLIGPHESTPAVSLTTASPENDIFPHQLPLDSHKISHVPDIVSSRPPQFDSSQGPRRNDSADWDPGADISTFDALSSRGHGLPGVSEVDETQTRSRTWEEMQAWENQERVNRENEAHEASIRAQQAEKERRAEEEWHRGEEAALREAQSGVIAQNRPMSEATLALAQMAFPPVSHDRGPSLPPRPSVEPPVPSKSLSSAGPSSSSGGEQPTPASPTSQKKEAKKAKKETYQIKQINWYDANSRHNPRRSPILVQNLNGPCPLLALVNALTLSTPAGADTALIETLRVREQISLGFLLDAVFDELMSGRRGDAAQELPDVGELYAFLSALHSGMNVNPRFRPLANPQNIMDLPHDSAPPNNIDDSSPGGFEETREMRFYSTFAVRLIHGWLPQKNHPAYAALERSAATYEDAQNLMFREEELEDKLQTHGLNPEEQLLLEDITTIKYFLNQSATQLTAHGLKVIQSSLGLGEIAILFRNDHFSTLYKHPQSGQLLQLITDAGYASHDEIIWESLVDVNGELCEFFSGDFRPIGNVAGDVQPTNNQSDDTEGWTTVERNGNKSNRSRTDPTLTPTQQQPKALTAAEPTFTPNTEQEDRDFALALQMQEEEEERERRETTARRREEDLSRTYLSSQTQPTEPPSSRSRRQRDRAQSQEVRSLVPPREPPRVTRASNVNDGGEAPPPTYEQAANGPAYVPPRNHPAHPSSPTGGRTPALPTTQTQPQSAYAQTATRFVMPHTSQSHPGLTGRERARQRAENVRASAQNLLTEMGPAPPGGNRRRQSYAGAASTSQSQQQEEKCVVM
ncbi:MAG: hypothetical protein M1814_000263 [Vezdaea aestivalis]|nr:MAG: hypothetical protein M1814_000263 [Vezdaea aestivalis]